MADLVSMRADVAEARQKIDSILAIDGELNTAQVAELERADKEFQRLSEEVRKAEIVDSAAVCRKAEFDFRARPTHNVAEKLDSRAVCKGSPGRDPQPGFVPGSNAGL